MQMEIVSHMVAHCAHQCSRKIRPGPSHVWQGSGGGSRKAWDDQPQRHLGLTVKLKLIGAIDREITFV